MAEFKYEIVKELGVIAEAARGWTRELNLVSWNDREPKFDIRDWSPDHTRMNKGITLSDEEFEALRRIMLGLEVDPDGDDVDEDEIL